MSIRDTDISAILNAIKNKSINFADVIKFIDDYYRYTPVAFVNGEQHNAAGENEGSAKVFALAKLHNLNQLDTLRLFAEHYDSVQANPDGTDHANIRNFMFWGWKGLMMKTNPLTPRPEVNTSHI